MKRWILVIALVVLLAALALTVHTWSPPLLAFVGSNTGLIQGLQAGLQILLWLGVAAVALFGYLRGKRTPVQIPPARSERASAIQTEGGAAARDVHTGGGDFVGRDQMRKDQQDISIGGDVTDSMILKADVVVIADHYWHSIQQSAAPPDLRSATAKYLGTMLDLHRYLNLKGMGVTDRVPLKLPLLDLYVPLRARLELPEGETWQRDLLLAGRRLPEGKSAGVIGRLSEPVPALDLLQRYNGLIILGDPGAGKTTFLKFLALRFALGQGDDLALGERLPVLVPLSAYANALAEQDIRLDDFVAGYLHDCGADLPIPQMLQGALHAGRALVLLDGLDEVKEPALRHTVVARLVDFYAYHRQAGNKFVITSRVVGYRDVRPTVEGLAECTLVDFDGDEIASFVERWTTALERQAQGDTATAATAAERERRELLDAIERNPSVRRLAANPLLLTILALMKRQGVTLPERRVELYDQYVTTLLSTWNRARGLGRPPSHDLDPKQTLRVLAPLALWMHEINPGVGLVKREELRREVAVLYTERGESDPEAAAGRFLEDVHEYAGLLLERGPGEYGFIHLTFEEYLAAVAIALRGQGDCRPIVDALKEHVGDPAWREVALLTVGYLGLIQQLDRVAGDVVETLAAEQPGAPGEAVVLAGEAVLDAWPAGVPPASKVKVVAALVATMQGAGVAAPLRRRAGLALGRLGWRPADLDDFVLVPAGEFLYGDKKEKRKISDRFWIGKYPVTNAQYARFVEDGGYNRQGFWSKDGWAWRTATYESTATEEFEKQWLALRPAELRSRPFWWHDADFNNPIFPVVGATWFEAEAYAKWMNNHLRDLHLSEPMPAGYIVGLPTEDEWERAGRGTDGREYPWEGEFSAAWCNTSEGGPHSITAVCTYPQGISPAGAWDLVGNVWEWTGSWWSAQEPSRVVRGGSWGDSRRYARCVLRSGDAPDSYDLGLGFRVVVSLSDSGF